MSTLHYTKVGSDLIGIAAINHQPFEDDTVYILILDGRLWSFVL